MEIDWSAMMGDSAEKAFEEANARMASRAERCEGPLLRARETYPESNVFSHVSLEGWMQQARLAGIALVDADVVARIPVDAIMNFEDPREEDRVHWKSLSAARSQLQAHEMLRWDCCASGDIKSVMHHGGPDAQENLNKAWMQTKDPVNPAVPAWRSALTPDDPRFFDIAYEYPGREIAVLKRPWVTPRTEGSHPAEYRVFVHNDEIVGVANYYIQRDMPSNDTVREEVGTAIELSKTLLESMSNHRAIVFNGDAERIPDAFEFGKVSCTLDFLVNEEGKVLFLEAGPPFGMGAHPCAFISNKPDGQHISVHGVALAVGQPPEPLKSFELSKRPSNKPF